MVLAIRSSICPFLLNPTFSEAMGCEATDDVFHAEDGVAFHEVTHYILSQC